MKVNCLYFKSSRIWKRKSLGNTSYQVLNMMTPFTYQESRKRRETTEYSYNVHMKIMDTLIVLNDNIVKATFGGTEVKF